MTLPELQGFPSSLSSSPLLVKARWGSTSALVLAWQALHPAALVVGYEIDVDNGGPRYWTTSTSLTIQGASLQWLRGQIEGGAKISYRAREQRFFDRFGGFLRADAPLLNVPGIPATVRVVPGTRMVDIEFTATENDGYGRATEDHDYGDPVDGVSLSLGYRLQIPFAEAGRDGLLKDETVVLANPRQSTKVKLTGLESNRRYSVSVFAFNSVGKGVPVQLPFETQADATQTSTLRVKIFLGGAAR